MLPPLRTRTPATPTFEEQADGTLYLIVVDIAGPEQCKTIAEWDHQMGTDSMNLVNDDIVICKLLQTGRAGHVRVLRHGSKLNPVLGAAFRDATVGGAPLGDTSVGNSRRKAVALRVVLCGNENTGHIVCKTMVMVPKLTL